MGNPEERAHRRGLARPRPRPRRDLPATGLAGDRDAALRLAGPRRSVLRCPPGWRPPTSTTMPPWRPCTGRLAGQSFDLIFVVAGVATQAHDPLHEVPRDVAAQVYLTNAVSPVRFAEAFLDRLAPQGPRRLHELDPRQRRPQRIGRLGDVPGEQGRPPTPSRAASRSATARRASACCCCIRAGSAPRWAGREADIDVATSVTGTADVIEGYLGTDRNGLPGLHGSDAGLVSRAVQGRPIGGRPRRSTTTGGRVRRSDDDRARRPARARGGEDALRHPLRRRLGLGGGDHVLAHGVEGQADQAGGDLEPAVRCRRRGPARRRPPRESSAARGARGSAADPGRISRSSSRRGLAFGIP